MESIEIPDRTRASLAPYLPIPYGTLKLLGLYVCPALAVVLPIIALSFSPWASAMVVVIAMLLLVVCWLTILAIEHDDVKGDSMRWWWSDFTKRNWRGYRLWVYRQNSIFAPVQYLILRAGDDPTHYLMAHSRFLDDRPRVMISVPLYGWGVPTVWVEDQLLVPRPFTVRLKDRKFRDRFQVIVEDFYGNRLTMPVELALEVVSDRTPRPLLSYSFRTLTEMFIGLRDEYDQEKDQHAHYGGKFMDARGAIEKAVEMIQASTRYQHSKQGKAIREFLELRLRMLTSGESEEEARKNLTDNAA